MVYIVTHALLLTNQNAIRNWMLKKSCFTHNFLLRGQQTVPESPTTWILTRHSRIFCAKGEVSNIIYTEQWFRVQWHLRDTNWVLKYYRRQFGFRSWTRQGKQERRQEREIAVLAFELHMRVTPSRRPHPIGAAAALSGLSARMAWYPPFRDLIASPDRNARFWHRS
jgi:hypothetical protein